MRNKVLIALTLYFIAGWLFAPVPAIAAADDDKSLTELIERHASPLVEGDGVVAMSVGVIAEKRSGTKAFGRMGLDDKTTPDAQTIYEIGSVSKVFTALLLADLVERGKAKLKTPVADLLPEGYAVPKHEGTPITLRDLATHRSALPRLPVGFVPADLSNPYADFSMDDLRKSLAATKLDRQPGTKYAYSNLGAGLLGFALAEHAGDDYEKLVTQRICRPLDMNSTMIEIAERDRQRMATAYDVDQKKTAHWDIPALAGAGALRSNVDDMLKFLAAHLDPEDTSLRGAIYRTHKSYGRLEGQPGLIALGWHIAADGSTYWHSGQTGGCHAFVAFNKAYRVAVVILATGNASKTDQLGFNLVRALCGIEVDPIEQPKIIKVDPDTFERYAGRYQLAPSFFLTVRRDGERLRVGATNQEEFQVYPIAETKFMYKVVEAQITFIVEDDGAVNKLILHQNGRDMPGTRVKE